MKALIAHVSASLNRSPDMRSIDGRIMHHPHDTMLWPLAHPRRHDLDWLRVLECSPSSSTTWRAFDPYWWT
jgi:hypothetical protein